MGKEVRVNLNFDKSWLDKNSYKDDEPPMRLLVASVREEQQVKIITADYTTLIVKMEESFWESFAEWIENFVREYYDEENIWKYVQIEGGKKGWKPNRKRKRSKNSWHSRTSGSSCGRNYRVQAHLTMTYLRK